MKVRRCQRKIVGDVLVLRSLEGKLSTSETIFERIPEASSQEGNAPSQEHSCLVRR